MSLDLTTTKNDASHLIYEKPSLDIKKLDSIDMMKDVLSGDTDLLARWEANLDAMGGIETLQTALKWLQEADPYGDYKQLIANEGWRLTYRRRPPTPEEFLTYEWIGPQCEALWPNIKKCFIEFLDPNPLNPARNMALSTSIGWGKQNPISSNVMTNKKIKIELEDGSIKEFESDEMIDVIIEGKSTKIQANELLKMNLSKVDFPQPHDMKIKSVACEYISKPLKELQIGDRVLGVNGDRPKILNIQKNGVQPTFTIKLSDGRSFRAGKGHFNTVHFRNSKLRPDKKVYDVLTVEYIKDHLDEYLFEIPTDDTFNLSEIDFWQHLEMLPCHENEPADQEDIIPDFNRDPNKVYIESIVPDVDEECWCLQLNDPLGLFAIEDRIFTHNSLLTNLILAYIIVLFGLMRKPYQLLGHSPMTAYSVGMCSATLNKAWDLLGVPFEQLIEQSPFFEKVGRHDDIVRVNEEDKECSKCYYTTAARGSAKMVFRNNLQLKLVSTEGALLGNTFVACMMTELAWWEQMGWTKEDIFRFFSKADQRVTSRMNGHYLGRSIIDSSPFSMESPIDKWIWEVALQDPKWYCVLGSKWDWFPDQFPNYFDKDGNEIHNWDVAFQCYKGGKSEPPKAISTAAEASTYDPLDLVWCPRENINSKGKVDFLQMAKQNAVEFLRDWAGIPAGSSDRIFQAGSTIDRIFDNDLRNIYTSIVADAMEQPEHLIWNKIKDIFFTKFGSQYMFYREPNAKRVLAVDQSTTGDATAISVCHNEYIKDGEDLLTVTIVDMTIVIIPKGGAVNLEAIKYFIQDLIDIGNLTIGNINFDKFQSDSTVQTLKRRGYKLDYISADKSNEPYTLLVDAIMHGRVFAGKNLFFKNNLRSLHMAQRESGSLKYDHFKGKICNESADTDWFSSQLGVNAKDCSDTVAECHCMLQKYATDYAPVREFVAYKKSGVEYNKELAALGLSI